MMITTATPSPPNHEDDSTMKESEALEQVFLHQNPVTGGVSRLTLRQLCRLLCPADSETASNDRSGTQVLQVLADGTYAPSGWQAAHTVPILRETLSQWYCEKNGATTGPFTCRQLASPQSILRADARLYSNELGKWALLEELPDLQIAIQAFDTPNLSSDVAKEAGYDAKDMAFPVNDDQRTPMNETIQDELDAFLASTDKLGNHGGGVSEDDDQEAYESDGGTKYVKDWRTGNWVHEALVAPRSDVSKADSKASSGNTNKRPSEATNKNPKKKKKAKFAARNAKCWIYLTGLPGDATEEEVNQFCSKVGILDLDPETQRPKIKLYRHKGGALAGQAKGDASVCYARPESVDLALTVLDEAPFRPEKDLKGRVRIERAKFEQHGTVFDEKRSQRISTAKRKVAQMAVKQAMDWDDGGYNGRLTGGLKGLRIVALQPLFSRDELTDEKLAKLEEVIQSDCEKCGPVEKITIFASNPRGVVVVKFAQPAAASEAIKLWDGRVFDGRKVEAAFWDGVTDYTVRDEAKEKAEMEARHEQFGEWLESQEIPEELRLKTET